MEIFELFCCFLELLELVVGVADGIAIGKSRENRRVRREARKRGDRKPRRDVWSWVVLVLTPVFLVVTCLLIWKWLGLFLSLENPGMT